MPKIAGQRATQADVNKVAGAAGVGENPPVITKEAGQKAEPAARGTGKKGQNNRSYSTSEGHDGVMGKRGGTST